VRNLLFLSTLLQFVILSEVIVSRSEAITQSKDPYSLYGSRRQGWDS
jgi:hypothetical protein